MKPTYLVLALLCGAAQGWADMPATPPAVAFNEFQGTVSSVEPTERKLRLQLDGGYNVEFTYDNRTVVKDGETSVKPTDLQYGDKVVARYQGKELYAKEIIRNAQAPALKAVPTEAPVASTPPTVTENPDVQSVVSSVTVSTPTP